MVCRLERWGRVGGFTRTFETGDIFGSEIDSSASVYRDVTGARNSWDSAAKFVRENARDVFEETGLNVLEASELPGSSLGDDTLRFRIRVSTEILGTPVTVETVIVSFRIANVVGAVTWVSFNESILSRDLDDIAQTQIRLINKAIERSTKPAETGA